MTSWPSVPALTKTFTVTITCAVQTLSFSAPPAALSNLIVGSDPQPMDIPFAISQFPACNAPTTYSLSPSTHTFLSLVNLTNSGGTVRVSGATTSDANLYSMVLTATQSTISSTANFEVNIKCNVTNLTIGNPIANIVHTIYANALTTSAFNVNITPNCVFPVTYQITYELLGSPVPTPSWSTFNQASRDFTFAAQLT